MIGEPPGELDEGLAVAAELREARLDLETEKAQEVDCIFVAVDGAALGTAIAARRRSL
jgi:hypothetical protein